MGARSPESRLKREQDYKSKQYIWNNSRKDPIQVEKYSLCTGNDILNHLRDLFPGCRILSTIHTDHERGEIIEDRYGQGTLQRRVLLARPHF